VGKEAICCRLSRKEVAESMCVYRIATPVWGSRPAKISRVPNTTSRECLEKPFEDPGVTHGGGEQRGGCTQRFWKNNSAETHHFVCVNTRSVE